MASAQDTSTPTILVLLTCHNRRQGTLGALRALERAAEGLARLQVVLVDAGSTDGTSEAVSQQFKYVRIIQTSNDIYWTAGMRMAWLHGREFPHSHVLWLNDDLNLRPEAMRNLLSEYAAHCQRHHRVILVGRVADQDANRTLYGGCCRRASIARFNFMTPQAGGEECDTFHGNCVLLPQQAFDEIGNLSPAYKHSFGDVDYGLRAKRAGYRIYQTRAVVGSQSINPQVYSGRPLRLTAKNIRYVFAHPKGMPPGEWLHFCSLHGGRFWPLYFIARYLWIFRLFRARHVHATDL